MFHLLWWRWAHLTWWRWSCVAEGHKCGWLKERGPPPGHGHCRLLNVCLQCGIKLEIWPLGWEHSFFTSTLRALHLSFCRIPCGFGYCLCLQRENPQMSFLSGSAGHPDLTWGHSLHSAHPPLPCFLKYSEQSRGPSSESGDLRHLGHQVLLPGGGSAAPAGWPAPWPGCCGGRLPVFFSFPSTGIVRHLTFLILLYGALEIK